MNVKEVVQEKGKEGRMEVYHECVYMFTEIKVQGVVSIRVARSSREPSFSGPDVALQCSRVGQKGVHRNRVSKKKKEEKRSDTDKNTLKGKMERIVRIKAPCRIPAILFCLYDRKDRAQKDTKKERRATALPILLRDQIS